MEQATLKELEAALAIARRGTFRAASIDLGISATALSHTIGRLEAALGVRLFNRTTRSVSLTDAGRLFIQQVAPSLEDLRAALDSVREQRDTPSGTIRINAAPFAARAIMSPLVLEFLRRYPDMNVDIVTEGKMVDIVRDGFDLGVRVEGLVPSDMIAVSLGRPQRHAVVGAPEYFKSHGMPVVPPDLLAHKCIRVRLPDGSAYRWSFEKEGEQVLIDVRGQLLLDEASLTRAAVLEGAGLGYLFEQEILPEIKSGRVIRVLEDWTPPYPGVCLYYPGRRNLSAGLRALLDLARELARQDRG